MVKEKFNPATPEDQANRERFDALDHTEKRSVIDRLHEGALIENCPNFPQLIETEKDQKFKENLTLAMNVAEKVRDAGGYALVVGGFVRDTILNKFGQELSPKDIDIEIYGLEFDVLQKTLESLGRLDVVGSAFGVVKLKGLDISIPRRDSKTGQGHKGFTIEGDPNMTVKEAAKRRDFTINALALDPITGEVLDFYGGIKDVQAKILRATDPESFGDDPLRVLRAAQFASRFGFGIEPTTLGICKSQDLKELPSERLGEEWQKLFLKSPKPSIGLEAARELGIIDQLHPEIQALFETPQDAEWHPEGTVWTHTKMVVDAAAEIVKEQNLDEQEALIILLGALCHDLGKPGTTTHDPDGRIRSKGHEQAGKEPTLSLLKSWNIPQTISDRVVPLVVDHLFPSVNKDASDKAIRRLSDRLAPATIHQLVMVAQADHKGRNIAWDGYPQGVQFMAKAEALRVLDSKPTKLIRGRDLIEMGVKPGRIIGGIIDKVYEAQLEGQVVSHEEALSYAQKLVNEIAKGGS